MVVTSFFLTVTYSVSLSNSVLTNLERFERCRGQRQSEFVAKDDKGNTGKDTKNVCCLSWS